MGVKLIKRPFLMWIFAISCIKNFASYDKLFISKTIMKSFVHIICDHRIISRCMLIRFYHQISSKFKRICAIFYVLQNSVIISHISYDNYIIKIFCRTSHHRRATNINVFDNFFKIISFFDSSFERVKIDTNQINPFNAKLICLSHMRSITTLM